ncbi:MAG: phage tail family protein [FCB group bacterium]|jgi:hypothetical protein|nr:phage tail family protein [FCB group bacterium]
MAIQLGTLTLDEANTAAREQYEEIAGRDVRVLVLTGLVTGIEDLDAQLDAILAAASDADYGCALSLRPGRRLWVRRTGFLRESRPDRGVGSFELKLESRDPYEESIELHSESWDIQASGTLTVSPSGNSASLPVVSITAGAALVNPVVSDGVRSIAYAGTVNAGEMLVFDSAAERVTLDGEEVTSYASGAFPRLSPGGTALTYTDDTPGPHAATATVAYRDRWW